MKKFLLPLLALMFAAGASGAETEQTVDELLPENFGIVADASKSPVNTYRKGWTSTATGIQYKASLTQYPKVGSNAVVCFQLSRLSDRRAITFARPDNLHTEKSDRRNHHRQLCENHHPLVNGRTC